MKKLFFDAYAPVEEIIVILNKHGIPIGGINTVFQRVKQEIINKTIPYNPNDFKVKEDATSEMTESVTELNG